MKNLEITLDQARQIFEDNGTPYMEAMKLHFGLEVLKPVKKLPSSCFDDLIGRSGWYTDFNSTLHYGVLEAPIDRNIFAKKQQAEAVLAMAQLSQHMAIWNGGWVADWNSRDHKYSIYFVNKEFYVWNTIEDKHFLTFKDRKTANLFLETFKDLIEQAKPLI